MPVSLPPLLRVPPPGPRSLELSFRHAERGAPMGPKPAAGARPSGIVLTRAEGSNVYCADDNRYVDLAAGFGAMLLGHRHPRVAESLERQAQNLWQALGDVYPSEPKVRLLEALAELYPGGEAQVLLGQSGADALTAALKTALLFTGKPGVLAFAGSYHGLSYAPLAVTDLRPSYRVPFGDQLAKDVHFLPFPKDEASAERCLAEAERLWDQVGAVVFEPIQGRAGVWPAPAGFWRELCDRAHSHGVLCIADEVWTGLGRAGAWLLGPALGAQPDLICLGKGLGGGLPISACLGPKSILSAWSRDEEVVHTSTFAGAPLAAATALTTLEVLADEQLIERSYKVGTAFATELREQLGDFPMAEVRGRGMMVGVDVADFPGRGRGVQKALLERGYLTTSGGGERNVLVLTPALNTPQELLSTFATTLREVLAQIP
jgi:4-aminobutyrate aminotransferase / (S)-3-amino-2-methylpropionate transaminase / 5-aminovalerate transaminase